MDKPTFYKGMAVIRQACLDARADEQGVRRFTVSRQNGQGVAHLGNDHVAMFIQEMESRYRVTCRRTDKGKTLQFVVRSLSPRHEDGS